MPQMAPMNWLILFWFFIMIFFIYNSINYFIFSYFFKNKKLIIKKIKYNWKW